MATLVALTPLWTTKVITTNKIVSVQFANNGCLFIELWLGSMRMLDG